MHRERLRLRSRKVRPSGSNSGLAAKMLSGGGTHFTRLLLHGRTIPRSNWRMYCCALPRMEIKYGLRCANVFHAGDGNLHPLILFDAIWPMSFIALNYSAPTYWSYASSGGTITGEHGVGIEKINSMCVQFSSAEISGVIALKRAFDPAFCSSR